MTGEYLNLSEVKCLCKAEHELDLLKNFLAGKLRGYCGISHSELINLCMMLGIIEPKEEKPGE